MADDPLPTDGPAPDDPPRAWPHRPPPSPPHEHRLHAHIPPRPDDPAPAPTSIWVGSAPDRTPPRVPDPPAAPPPIGVPPAPRGSVLAGAVLVIAAGVGLVVAAFLPWVVGTGIEVDGWHATGDAKFLLGAGIVALAVGSLIVGAVPLRLPRVLIFLGAVATLAVAASDIVDATHVANVEVPSPRAGSGPWVALAAGVILLASLWFVRREVPG